mmetsp:Transcript_2305/g.8027  ORF Transcript_2305/g.8027 Transcript_2305/m.8027 type:complete len:233 (-) Transcript_2305:632-1330(-)
MVLDVTPSTTAVAIHCDPGSCTSNQPLRYVSNPKMPTLGRPSRSRKQSGAPRTTGGCVGKGTEPEPGVSISFSFSRCGVFVDDESERKAPVSTAVAAPVRVLVATPSSESARFRCSTEGHIIPFLRIISGATCLSAFAIANAFASPRSFSKRLANQTGSEFRAALFSATPVGQASPATIFAPPRSTRTVSFEIAALPTTSSRVCVQCSVTIAVAAATNSGRRGASLSFFSFS